MVIRFICPNGHQLSAPDDRAGKPAKCPTCQTAFLVPDLEEEESAEEDQAAESPGPPAAGDNRTGGSPPTAGTLQASRDIIVFLCPNGHKLNGPVSLKGRPGQCPHCGAKFIVPGDDDVDDEEVDEEAVGEEQPAAPSATGPPPVAAPDSRRPPPPPSTTTGAAAAENVPAPELDDIPDISDELAEEIELLDAEGVEEISGISVIHGQQAPASGPLAQLLSLLGAASPGQLAWRIELRDGQTVEANRFSSQLSRDDYAVFAEQKPGESPIVHLVRCDQIRQITIRGLRELPSNW